MELLSNVSTHAPTSDHSSQKLPAPPHQTVRMVFPYTAFRCSSSGGMRLGPARKLVQTWPADRVSSVASCSPSGLIARWQSPDPPLVRNVNKVGSLPSGGVVLSFALNRYYEPLRLPRQPSAPSVPLIRLGCGFYARTAVGLPFCTVSLPPHAAPATPEDPEGGCSFCSLRQRPSPSDHRVGISK